MHAFSPWARSGNPLIDRQMPIAVLLLLQQSVLCLSYCDLSISNVLLVAVRYCNPIPIHRSTAVPRARGTKTAVQLS